MSAKPPGLQGITQVIDAPRGLVQNIAEFSLVGIDGYLNVEGTVSPVVPSGKGKDEAVRVDVAFTAFVVKVGALPGLRIPLNWISPKVGQENIDDSACASRGAPLCSPHFIGRCSSQSFGVQLMGQGLICSPCEDVLCVPRKFVGHELYNHGRAMIAVWLQLQSAQIC